MPPGGLALGPCCCANPAGACLCDACGRALADILTMSQYYPAIGRTVAYPLHCDASQGRPNHWVYADIQPFSATYRWMKCEGGVVYFKESYLYTAYGTNTKDTGWIAAGSVACGTPFTATWTGFPDLFNGDGGITVTEPPA